MNEPSAWVLRFAQQVPPGPVLDLACGGGRHTRLFLQRGHPVVAVDRTMVLGAAPDLERMEADLEAGGAFPLAGRAFSGVVVTNYLHRPLLPAIVAAVAPGGLLVYETFAVGNERFGRPRNPDFLLRPGELFETVRGELRVLAYDDLVLDAPRPAAIQRVCARRDG